MKSPTEILLDKVRKAIASCDASEQEIYEELLSEAEGWKMRLEELDDEAQRGN